MLTQPSKPSLQPEDKRTDKVNIYHLLELSTLHLMHRDALDDASIIDEDIYLANFFMNGFDKGFHIVFLGDVADIAVHVGDACLAIIVPSTLKSRFIDIVKHDVLDARGYKCLSNVESDTIRCACYPRILTFKRE